jgi:DNA-binding winged helix-turn-helix (wHTH) protein
MTHFPPFTFDPRDRTLWRGATEIALTPKAAALLACLLAARGAWVSKDTILAAVWPDTHVQPDNIKVLVREIRGALGDSTAAHAFIGSMPRRGYAFVAPIVERAQPPEAEWILSPRTQIFVDRGAEIAGLTAAVGAAPGSSPRLALIAGDRGGGKTLLCDAFLRSVRASGSARICYTQCSDRELTPEPYYPILDALLRLERHYPGVARGALAVHAPAWLALFPEWSGSSRRSGSEPRGSMLEQLSAAVAVMAGDVPLVIVFDDIQWADTDTVRALLHVGARGTRARVLFVATCHEGAWVAGDSARERTIAAPGTLSLRLPPFTRQQTGQYIVARFGSGPLEALAPIVHAASGGNPLMIATAFDSLVERRAIVRGQNGWRRERSIAAIARVLPDALADMVTRQLELLELHEREAIEAAAAVGFEFSLGEVAAALRADPREVAAVIAPLARRGHLLVAGHAHGAVPAAGDSYRFRHAFYVEVIARRAPQRRQRAFAARVSGLRAVAHRLAT